jgi:hypothetical protein
MEAGAMFPGVGVSMPHPRFTTVPRGRAERNLHTSSSTTLLRIIQAKRESSLMFPTISEKS